MPKATYAKCRACGAKRDDVGLLSRTRLCDKCGHALLTENATGIHEHRGPAFHRWRRGMAASVGAILPEDL
jgi:hypothetical protein